MSLHTLSLDIINYISTMGCFQRLCSGEAPVKASHRCAVGEDGVQAKRGLSIQHSLGDGEAEAADWEVRQSPRVGTEHGEKRAAAFGKQAASSRFVFLLDVCGLNCQPLKFSSSQDRWLMDRLSRRLKKFLCPIQGRFPPCEQTLGPCLPPAQVAAAKLTMPGFFRGL